MPGIHSLKWESSFRSSTYVFSVKCPSRWCRFSLEQAVHELVFLFLPMPFFRVPFMFSVRLRYILPTRFMYASKEAVHVVFVAFLAVDVRTVYFSLL